MPPPRRVSAPGGCLVPGEGVSAPRGCLVLGGVCSWGVSALGGVWSQGVSALDGAWWRPPGRLLLRAVRILLECILVLHINLLVFTGPLKNHTHAY